MLLLVSTLVLAACATPEQPRFGPDGRRVQIILLDTRFFKDNYKKDPRPKEERLQAGKVGAYLLDNDPAKTMLGDDQWRWLVQQLKMYTDAGVIGVRPFHPSFVEALTILEDTAAAYLTNQVSLDESLEQARAQLAQLG